MCFPLPYKEENNIGRLVIGIMCYTLHNGNLAIFVIHYPISCNSSHIFVDFILKCFELVPNRINFLLYTSFYASLDAGLYYKV